MASIRKRGSSYLIVVSMGYDYNGKRIKSQQKTVHPPEELTPKQVEKWLNEQAVLFERDCRHTPQPVQQLTLAKYIDLWLTDIAPGKLAKSTIRRDRQDIERILPVLGHYKLTELRPEHFRNFYAELRKVISPDTKKPLSEYTIEGVHATLCSILSDAVEGGFLSHNPAWRTYRYAGRKCEKKIADEETAQRIIAALEGESIKYETYFKLIIATGMRRGECCALQWRDITGACELTVRRCRSCASGQIVESDTKSHRERIVTIPLGIWELLMALRQQQVLHSGVPDREQPIFTDPEGHVPHPDTFTRHLRKLYKQCGLSEDYHLHTLRHFYATYLLQEGASKQVAASLLGHADTAFLERTYCHPQDVAKRQAANLMQDLLNNQNPCYVAFMKNRNRKPKKAG